MARKSTAAKAINIDVKASYIEPRPGFSKPLADLFREIVRAAQPEHFVPSDRMLLERYCEAINLAEIAQTHLEAEGPVTREGRVSPWVTVQEKGHRSAVALAGKLRLCPHSRLDRKVAGSTTRPSAQSRPWEE